MCGGWDGARVPPDWKLREGLGDCRGKHPSGGVGEETPEEEVEAREKRDPSPSSTLCRPSGPWIGPEEVSLVGVR